MKKADREELTQLFLSVVQLFGGICDICKQPLGPEDAWVFHHRKYRVDRKGNLLEKTYDDFRFPNGEKDRLSYHRYLIPVIKKNPKRFQLIHNTHHHQATMYWAIYGLANFERMVIFARQIIIEKARRKRISSYTTTATTGFTATSGSVLNNSTFSTNS